MNLIHHLFKNRGNLHFNVYLTIRLQMSVLLLSLGHRQKGTDEHEI